MSEAIARKSLPNVVEIESHVPVIDRILTAAPASLCRSELELVQFPSSTSCEKALLALNRANITGAPVYREVAITPRDGAVAPAAEALVLDKVVYTGFVDVADISVLMLTKGLKRAPAKGLIAKVASYFKPDLEHQVDHAMNMSGLDPFRWVSMSSNLKEAAALLTTSGAHRVAVVDHDNNQRIRGIVTPCGILRAIRDNISELGELGAVPVGSLFDIRRGGVLTAHKDLTARQSLKKLLQHGFSGMPVVDDNGAVVSALSFSHLRTVATLKPQRALKALQEHSSLWLATRDANGEEDKLALQRNMTVLPSDSLSTAITMLAFSRAHRMYIVDSDRRPVGVITIRSLIRLLLSPKITVHMGWRLSADSSSWRRTLALFDRMPPADTIRDVLRSTNLLGVMSQHSTLITSASLPTIPRHAAVEDAVKLLKDNGLHTVVAVTKHAVPVPYLLAGAKSSAVIVPVVPASSYVGWIDAATIVAARLAHPHEYAPSEQTAAHLIMFDLEQAVPASASAVCESRTNPTSTMAKQDSHRVCDTPVLHADAESDSCSGSSVSPTLSDSSATLNTGTKQVTPPIPALLKKNTTSVSFKRMDTVGLSESTVKGGYHQRASATGRYCRNPFWSLCMHSGLDQALHVLAARSLSRIAAVDTLQCGRPLVGLLHRLDILHVVAAHRQNLGRLADVRVRTILSKHPSSECNSIAGTATLREALTVIMQQQLFGLPVVDDSGRLQAHLTLHAVESLAIVSRDDFAAAMDQSVLEYLEAHRERHNGNDIWVSSFPVTVRAEDSLGSLVELMSAAKLESVSVVDANMHVLGKISIVDVLRMLC